MNDIDIGGEFDLEGGRKIKLLPISDERPPNNLRCFDADGRLLWAAIGEFTGAWWDGTKLSAYDGFGFNKTIDDQTGEVLSSIFVK